MSKPRAPVTGDPWRALRLRTPARIGLGRAGASLPTREVLAFGMAHAQARDAVHEALDVDDLMPKLQALGFPAVRVRSRARDRAAYLMRPDLGRRLDADCVPLLQALPSHARLAIVLADGLSAQAVQRHALPLLMLLRQQLGDEWNPLPVVVAEQGRVALGDEVGELLAAQLIAVFIGERPGLSSPDSLGVYLTFQPRIGRRDSERNCVSNIRPEGLAYTDAARTLGFLVTAALRLGLTGVGLADESGMSAGGSIEAEP
ncbi:Ethanolamine ammonia-lyase light chain [Noviherbaspirillum humi]|uniref:Ethanolamine ammonia-lyase small subunit n=1 Tax=Noviherbaspirillum humi TaxID=1688639 RepID=A0A239GWD6_9BURK|nr:ethanolamine ammonia-lyase subunit EutC [Noviherbaspirillum humi]SNS72843.1 Ethanolamine ammonia-lyase light chain [Noviherbaspirillum humi]